MTTVEWIVVVLAFPILTVTFLALLFVGAKLVAFGWRCGNARFDQYNQRKSDAEPRTRT